MIIKMGNPIKTNIKAFNLEQIGMVFSMGKSYFILRDFQLMIDFRPRLSCVVSLFLIFLMRSACIHFLIRSQQGELSSISLFFIFLNFFLFSSLTLDKLFCQKPLIYLYSTNQ